MQASPPSTSWNMSGFGALLATSNYTPTGRIASTRILSRMANSQHDRPTMRNLLKQRKQISSNSSGKYGRHQNANSSHGSPSKIESGLLIGYKRGDCRIMECAPCAGAVKKPVSIYFKTVATLGVSGKVLQYGCVMSSCDLPPGC
jgi:hypothetical protein